MIEYLYSRMITTMASVALVAVVTLAAIGASDQASFRCAVDIAESISEIVAEASVTDAEYFEQRLLMGSGSSTGDISVMLNDSFVEVVNGKHSVKRIFEQPVHVLANGARVSFIEAEHGSAIVIRSSKELFHKENNVTIEVVAASSLYLSNGGDEPLGILAVVVDVE